MPNYVELLRSGALFLLENPLQFEVKVTPISDKFEEMCLQIDNGLLSAVSGAFRGPINLTKDSSHFFIVFKENPLEFDFLLFVIVC